MLWTLALKVFSVPKIAKPLTAAAVSKLRQPGRYPVGGVDGLMLRVTSSGTRLWVCRVVAFGKRRDFGLGRYDEVSLSQARDAARELRLSIRRGIDPTLPPEEPLSLPIPHSFKEAADAFISGKQHEWKNQKHKQQWVNTLETYAHPVLGKQDVASIALSDILEVLQPIWVIKTETASRLRGRIEVILDYAAVQGWRDNDNPARWKGLLDKVLPSAKKLKNTQHYPAMPFSETPVFMKYLEEVQGIGALALRFLILTAARTNEVLASRWSEINLDSALWTIPAERMKAEREHFIPLSKQAIQVLLAIPRLDNSNWIFPSPRKKGDMLSNNVLRKLMQQYGVHYVPHGFRSTFRDWVGDETEYPRELAEAALAHVIEDETEAAYRRSTAIKRRRPLMQDWADSIMPPPV